MTAGGAPHRLRRLSRACGLTEVRKHFLEAAQLSTRSASLEGGAEVSGLGGQCWGSWGRQGPDPVWAWARSSGNSGGERSEVGRWAMTATGQQGVMENSDPGHGQGRQRKGSEGLEARGSGWEEAGHSHGGCSPVTREGGSCCVRDQQDRWGLQAGCRCVQAGAGPGFRFLRVINTKGTFKPKSRPLSLLLSDVITDVKVPLKLSGTIHYA